jgi:tetratricopeptide (TPR) repeat protein
MKADNAAMRLPILGPRLRSAFGACLAMFAGVLALEVAIARDRVDVSRTLVEGTERILIAWPEALASENLSPESELRSSVLIVGLPRQIEADLTAFDELPANSAIARVRLDPDGRTLRFALRRDIAFETQRSDNLIAVDFVPAEGRSAPKLISPLERARILAREEAAKRARAAAIEAAKPKGPVDVPITISAADTFSRILMEWPVPAEWSAVETPGKLELQFDWDARPDMTRLRIDPPPGVTSADHERTDQGLKVVLGLDEGYGARVFRDVNAVVIDVTETKEELAPLPEQSQDDDSAGTARADQRMASPLQTSISPVIETAAPVTAGPVRTEINPIPGGYEIVAQFTDGGIGASVYERSGRTYIVFDADAELVLAGYDLRASSVVNNPETSSGPGYALLSFVMEGSTQLTPSQQGTRWVFSITPERDEPVRDIQAEREGLDAMASLVFIMPEAMRVVRIRDPLIGDEVLVAAALAGAPGNIKPRRFLDATVLPSLHGLAVAPNDDAVSLVRVEKGVSLRREGGLRISPPAVAVTAEAMRLPDGPAFVNAARLRQPAAQFFAEKDRLERAFARSDSLDDHYRIAEFLIANNLAHEALGVLRVIGVMDPAQVREARFAGLSGIANVLAHRSKEGLEALAHNELGADPYAAVWRALAHERLGQYAEARREFVAGDSAFYSMPEDWGAALKLANVRAAIEMNDVAAAGRHLDLLEAKGLPEGSSSAHAMLLRAELMAISGNRDAALSIYGALMSDPNEEVSATASFRDAILRQERGDLTSDRVIETLEALRYRWRGDALELRVTEALGEQLYQSGRTLEGLRVMQSAVHRQDDGVQARRISRRLTEIFRELFLKDGAQHMQPIEALGLFYEFSALTPIGADGDRMIRRLSDRLVDMDLLKQAAELLEHQTSNRLRGSERAEVAADLAAIYLMDRQPEAALNTLRASRIARLPEPLIEQRRYLEARALGAVGRVDHAFELLEGDDSPTAASIRADTAWNAKDYERAAEWLELAATRRMGAILTAQVSRDLLRSALGYQLSGQNEKLRALKVRHDDRMRRGPDASAWTIVTDEVQADGGLGLRDLSRSLTKTDALDEFLADFRAQRDLPAGSTDPVASVPDAGASENTEPNVLN